MNHDSFTFDIVSSICCVDIIKFHFDIIYQMKLNDIKTADTRNIMLLKTMPDD